MVDEDNVLGFLCDNERLVTIIDDEEVVLLLSKNVVTDAEPIIYSYTKYRRIYNECKLVIVGLEQLYSNRFYPRTYYKIFKLQLLPAILDQHILEQVYILEQFNGSTGYTAFYPCQNYWECREIIRKKEDLDLEED